MISQIKQISIFIIITELTILTLPDRKYEKYLRSLVSLLVVLIILSFFSEKCFGFRQDQGAVSSFFERLENGGSDDGFANQNRWDEGPVQKYLVQSYEEEIKDKLNSELKNNIYYVKQVSLTLTKAADFAYTGGLKSKAEAKQKDVEQAVTLQRLEVLMSVKEGTETEGFTDYERQGELPDAAEIAAILEIDMEFVEVYVHEG